jgi:uncharacterized repeat protein (TIGR03803 family)
MGGSDGEAPGYADLIFDPAGNLYGTTSFGGGGGMDCSGTSCGTVYELTPSGGSWTESVLYRFNPQPDGYDPYSGVIRDSAGNLYGTTFYGGTYGPGVVYELIPSGSGWTENILYDFQGGSDGGNPVGNLIFDQSGNLYGGNLTGGGGSDSAGVVFELTPSNGIWTLTPIYAFTGTYGGGPAASLVMDAAGSLYGTTYADGLYGFGNVFKLTPSGGGWMYTSLYDFTGGSDGANPGSTPVFDANGNLYGTTRSGGAFGKGVAFEITQPF